MTKTYGKIYSVDEISSKIKKLLEKRLQNVWVRGEISNFGHHNKKHMYFSLKDDNSVIRCVMFRRANKKLKFKPKEGMEVLVRGGISVYKKKGDYQIIVEEMKVQGKGKLYAEYLKLKKKLKKEGLFKKNKDLPLFPSKIGVVTSSEGAAVRDIIRTIKRRYPADVLLYPTLVQGDNAKQTIAKGVGVLDGKVDVIIVARGGGSFEDLWPFNEEVVAKAIFNSKTPVVSGVGHQTDYTISDFVADKRGTTPAGAAELVVPEKEKFIDLLENKKERLVRGISRIFNDYKQKMKYLVKRPLFKRPFLLIDENKQTIDDREEEIKRIMKKKINSLREKFEKKGEKLDALNPYSVIKRGYSITLKEGKIIENVNNLNVGDTINTKLKNGEINSRVEKISEDKNG